MALSSLPSTVGPDQASISGWTNAFILDVFTSNSETRESGKDLLTAMCNKMLAGQMRSPLWLLSRLILIPKPSDNPSAPITLRPLGLPEIFYRLAQRAAVRIEGLLVGLTMEPVQLGVGIPFGYQIGAKGAQCAFDARKALLAVDLNNAFNTEKQQSTFQELYALVPRLLRYNIWGYGRKTTPQIWHGQLVGSSGTGVKQGDPAGPLYFAVSTHGLFCSIRDTIERVTTDYFSLLPSFVGITATSRLCQTINLRSRWRKWSSGRSSSRVGALTSRSVVF